jgi:hypothetical protein
MTGSGRWTASDRPVTGTGSKIGPCEIAQWEAVSRERRESTYLSNDDIREGTPRCTQECERHSERLGDGRGILTQKFDSGICPSHGILVHLMCDRGNSEIHATNGWSRVDREG